MRILFTGDVSFTGCFSKVESLDSFISDDLRRYIKSHNYACVNLEGPATNEPNQYDHSLKVASPPESIGLLINSGVTHFNIANNHTFDCGLSGFEDTIKNIRDHGGIYFGAGYNLEEASKIVYLTEGDLCVAMIAIGEAGSSEMLASESSAGVFSENHLSHVELRIKEARAKGADFVVLNYHNGTEYNFYPVAYIRDKLNRLLKMGVDVVVGHHPHVIQPIAYKQGKVVCYSLGNFIFDLAGHDRFKHTDNSMLLSLVFEKGKKFSLHYKFTKIDKKFATINFLEESNTYEFLNEIVEEKIKEKSIKYFLDNIRVIFGGLPIAKRKKIKAIIFYPVYILYRLKGAVKGNSKAIVQEMLEYMKMNFLLRFFKAKDSLNRNNEY